MGLGCPACGAGEDHLDPADLAASGTVYSLATVHRHRGRDVEAPFVMGEIQLDDGPLIRATMAVAEHEVSIGQRVVAQWLVQRTDDEGNDIVEPRFAPQSDALNGEGQNQ